MEKAWVTVELDLIEGYLISLMILDEENKALRRHIQETEDRITRQLGPRGLAGVKVGGFNYQCRECKEFFDIPGLNHGCPFCSSYELQYLDQNINQSKEQR